MAQATSNSADYLNKAQSSYDGAYVCLERGCISEFWRGPHQAVFVLRQAQHERTILSKFNPSPVRPELVEGGTAGSQRALTELPEN